METSGDFSFDATNKTDDEFGFYCEKIIKKQSILGHNAQAIKNEIKTLSDHFIRLKEQKEPLVEKRESLKSCLIREQDNADHFNSKLNEEIASMKELLSDVEIVNNHLNDFDATNSFVNRFLAETSENCETLQQNANDLISNMTKMNLEIRDRVIYAKEITEKREFEIHSDIILYENDLEYLENALSFMKKLIFEKNLEEAKASIAAEYVCFEENKDTMNLQNFKKKHNALVEDGKKAEDEKKILISNLKNSNEILIKELSRLDKDEQEMQQNVYNVDKNINELEEVLKQTLRKEQSSIEELKLKDQTLIKLTEEESSLKTEFEIKENTQQENELMMKMLAEMEKQYNELVTGDSDLNSATDCEERQVEKLTIEIETESLNESKVEESKDNLKSQIRYMESHLNNINQNHCEDVNSLKEETTNIEANLNALKKTLLECQASITDKKSQLQDYGSKMCDSENEYTTVSNLAELETAKINEYEQHLNDIKQKFMKSIEEMAKLHDLKKKELLDFEIIAKKIETVAEEKEQIQIEMKNQKDHNKAEFLQLEKEHEYSKKDAEAKWNLLKIELESIYKKLEMESVEAQTYLIQTVQLGSHMEETETALQKQLKQIKNKAIQVRNTRELLVKRLANTGNLCKKIGTDSGTPSQILSESDKGAKTTVSNTSLLPTAENFEKQTSNNDVDSSTSSSGISTSDPRWGLPSKRTLSTETTTPEQQPEMKKKMIPLKNKAQKKSFIGAKGKSPLTKSTTAKN